MKRQRREKLDPRELGPAEPQHGMTERQARERKERVALQMLREGYSAVAIEERFIQDSLNLTRLARKHGIDLRARGHGLPGGLPIL
jgi:cytosine/adenosine deaminase-related metal-dependent hydrolase